MIVKRFTGSQMAQPVHAECCCESMTTTDYAPGNILLIRQETEERKQPEKNKIGDKDVILSRG